MKSRKLCTTSQSFQQNQCEVVSMTPSDHHAVQNHQKIEDAPGYDDALRMSVISQQISRRRPNVPIVMPYPNTAPIHEDGYDNIPARKRSNTSSATKREIMPINVASHSQYIKYQVVKTVDVRSTWYKRNG